MTKVIIKDSQSLQKAKDKTRGIVSFRKMKDGRVIAVKCPSRRKKK